MLGVHRCIRRNRLTKHKHRSKNIARLGKALTDLTPKSKADTTRRAYGESNLFTIAKRKTEQVSKWTRPDLRSTR